jgi:small conductance mechanosensitive channel
MLTAVTVPMSLMDLPKTCQDPDSYTCGAVYDWTGNEELAHAAAWVIGKPFAILWLVLLGLVARWLLHRLINRVVGRAQAGVLPAKFARGPFAEPEGETTVHRRAQRAATMGSLLKSIVTVVIFVVVLIMGISELGYDVAPLIASAGIVGIALGFGAQSLV